MTKQLDLTQMGLVEMNSTEMKEVDGGGIFGAILGAVVGAVIGLLNQDPLNPDNSWITDAAIGAAYGSLLPF